MENVCIFDIETIPDADAIARLQQVDCLSPDEQFDFAELHRRSEVGHTFMRHHLHKVASIALCFSRHGKFKVASVGEIGDDEKTLLTKFFNLIDTYRPQLVSWNGSGFDLPVLHYRALFHGVAAPTYWDVGHFDNGSKWNNYLSRFQWQHIDLMDVIAGYQGRCVAPLNDIAKLCGFPGKLATDGSAVLDLYKANRLDAIRDYCETDVLNTYLVYLRFELIRGLCSAAQYQQHIDDLKAYLRHADKPHFDEFLTAWDNT